MVQITTEYTGDLHTVSVHGPSGARVETDAPVDNHGKGETFSPTDLVATALGACMFTIMGIVAKRDGIALEGSRVSVEKHMTTEPPRRIAALDVVFDLPGSVEERDRTKLQRAAESCPVHASLHPETEIRVEYRWG